MQIRDSQGRSLLKITSGKATFTVPSSGSPGTYTVDTDVRNIPAYKFFYRLNDDTYVFPYIKQFASNPTTWVSRTRGVSITDFTLEDRLELSILNSTGVTVTVRLEYILYSERSNAT